ncbi:MAG: hypothetical protein Q9192_003493 [Flavoplaca navasiana]
MLTTSKHEGQHIAGQKLVTTEPRMDISGSEDLDLAQDPWNARAGKIRIQRESEAKAIDAGANFASESFLLSVGIGLIIFERWWSSRKESNRREDVADRIKELKESEKAARRALVELEKEIIRIRGKDGKEKSPKRILPKDIWEPEEREEDEKKAKSSRTFKECWVSEWISSCPPKAAQQPLMGFSYKHRHQESRL